MGAPGSASAPDPGDSGGESPPAFVGRRIVLWGSPGSGKTTLSRKLGEALDLHVVQLDAIRHERGWDCIDATEMRAKLTERLEGAEGGWVCEGGYSSIRDVYLSRADTLVWLRLPLRVSFPRLLRRTLQRSRDPRPLYGPDGPRESLRMGFASRDSILFYALHTHGRNERRRAGWVAELPNSIRVHELRSPEAVQAFEARVLAPAEASSA